ncbi:MAG: site-2 protease family protein [Candidatus Saccharibacteria bacterium]
MTADLSITNLGIIFVVILISMGLHEAMHGFVAHWLGDSTAQEAGRLTLNPLKHIDGLTTILLPVVLIALGLPPIFAAKPVPFNPSRVKYEEFGAALIGLAGPFTNLALAIVVAGVAHLTIGYNTFLTTFLVIFVQVNVGFFVFNMLPIPPLDGSRLIYALVPEPVQEVMARFEQMGIVAVIVILVVLMPVIGPIITNLNQAVLTRLL